MSGPVRVLVVATTFPRSAGDDQPRFILDLCKSLPADIEPYVLAPSAPGLPVEDTIEGVPVRRFRYWLNRFETLAYGSGMPANLRSRPWRWLLVPLFVIACTLAIRRELRRLEPAIVHAHWWLPAGLAAVLATARAPGRQPVLITCHGSDYFVFGERLPRLRRWVFERADSIAMVSEAMLTHALERRLPADKLCVAAMGADLQQRFVPEPADARRGVLYVGRLVDKKGIDDLLSAWAGVNTATRSQGLTIVGSGAQLVSLRQLASSSGMSDSVHFAGAIGHDELPNYYRQAALLVFPSVGQEGLGLVVIEAMGCDCPVLAANMPSLSGIVDDAKTGFTFAAGDRDALRRRLDELLADPDRCREIGRHGGGAVRTRFDWAAAGSRYGSLYAAIARGERRD